jgi:hypothetical protein
LAKTNTIAPDLAGLLFVLLMFLRPQRPETAIPRDPLKSFSNFLCQTPRQ